MSETEWEQVRTYITNHNLTFEDVLKAFDMRAGYERLAKMLGKTPMGANLPLSRLNELNNPVEEIDPRQETLPGLGPQHFNGA